MIRSLCLLSIGGILLSGCWKQFDPTAFPAAYSPRHYIAYRTADSMLIDGKLSETAWQAASASEEFVDIEGLHKTKPLHTTDVRILWDDEYLYFGATLAEPHLWATLTKRESVIFQDNDFEIFIDPDGDTHTYMEFEINALGTEWDLLLNRPYRDWGNANNAWNIEGLRTAVHLYGTLNDPADTDTMWTVEIAMPWASLVENTHSGMPPIHGDQWRVNFSRVQWKLDTIGGVYAKTIDKTTGKPFPENNWVWSPQHEINMHAPESWGFLQFSSYLVGTDISEFVMNSDEYYKWILREVYLAQRKYRKAQGEYATDIKALTLRPDINHSLHAELSISGNRTHYTATIVGPDEASWQIREDGWVWKLK